jgi:hypothetical protein
MPIHDWSRVKPGIFHDFHHAWIARIRAALNSGLLPEGYYAMAEQVTGSFGPDVLTLEAADGGDPSEGAGNSGAVCTLSQAPPQIQFVEEFAGTEQLYSVVIRHVSGDHIIAMIEIVSPGNKSSRVQFDQFIEKSARWLMAGYHLLVVDIHPRTKRDPRGIHVAIWEELGTESAFAESEKPFTLVSYRSQAGYRAYVEPVDVGDQLPPMPLLLDGERYVNVPLEETYQQAFAEGAAQIRSLLE